MNRTKDKLEQAIIGSLFMDYELTMDELERNGIGFESFSGVNSEIYKLIVSTHNEYGSVDTVIANPKYKKLCDTHGIKYWYLDDCMDSCPTEYHAQAYARQLREMNNNHLLIRLGNTLASGNMDLQDAIKHAEDTLFNISTAKAEARSFDEICMLAKQDWIDKREGKTNLGPCSRFEFLNTAIGGYHGVVIVAARPGQGKSTFMLNEALTQAKAGYKPFIASLEMPAEMCVKRMASDEGNMSAFVLDCGLGENSFTFGMAALEKIKSLPIIVEDDTMNIDTLCSSIRRAKLKHDIDIAYVDYIQCISRSHGESGMKKHERIGYYSKRLTALQKQLGIPIVVLSQINRTGEGTVRPKNSDLKDSGEIEEDAFIIIMISASEAHASEGLLNKHADIEVTKNRTGRVTLRTVEKKFNFSKFIEKTDEQER